METWHTTEKSYLISVAVLLFLTGAAKLVSANQSVSVLAMSDPLIGFLSIRQTSIIAGVLEAIIAIYLLTSSNRFRKLEAIIWLSVLFITYHVGLYLIGFHGMCPCLGNANAWLRLSDKSINMAVKCLLAYFLVGSLSMLYFRWRLVKHKSRSNSIS